MFSSQERRSNPTVWLSSFRHRLLIHTRFPIEITYRSSSHPRRTITRVICDIYGCIYERVYIYISICVCVCVYIYTHIHISSLSIYIQTFYTGQQRNVHETAVVTCDISIVLQQWSSARLAYCLHQILLDRTLDQRSLRREFRLFSRRAVSSLATFFDPITARFVLCICTQQPPETIAVVHGLVCLSYGRFCLK